MSKLHRALSWLFGAPEELTSGTGIVYLYRWRVIYRRAGSVYIHHFVADDGARDPHNHPRVFWSLGLWGTYVEERYRISEYGNGAFLFKATKRYRAPWLRRFPPEHTHRISLPKGGSCWTLVYAGAVVRDWGFWQQRAGDFHIWVPWRDYSQGLRPLPVTADEIITLWEEGRYPTFWVPPWELIDDWDERVATRNEVLKHEP